MLKGKIYSIFYRLKKIIFSNIENLLYYFLIFICWCRHLLFVDIYEKDKYLFINTKILIIIKKKGDNFFLNIFYYPFFFNNENIQIYYLKILRMIIK